MYIRENAPAEKQIQPASIKTFPNASALKEMKTLQLKENPSEKSIDGCFGCDKCKNDKNSDNSLESSYIFALLMLLLMSDDNSCNSSLIPTLLASALLLQI